MKRLIISRISTTAIALDPDKGLMVYQKLHPEGFHYFSRTTWEPLGGKSSLLNNSVLIFNSNKGKCKPKPVSIYSGDKVIIDGSVTDITEYLYNKFEKRMCNELF